LAAALASSDASQAAITKFEANWNAIKTYTCTITSHEVRGADVQDRVYHFSFSKPFDTRAEIIGGDGHGSVGVWRGGDKVRGHQGGILSGIVVNVGLHSRLATTMRGTTFAESNLGSLLDHLKSLPVAWLDAKTDGKTTLVTVTNPNPPADSDAVTKESYFFGPDGWLTSYEEYAGDTLVKRVTYSEMKLNPDLPASTFEI